MAQGDYESINENFKNKDIISIDQFNRNSFEKVLNCTKELSSQLDKKKIMNLLEGTLTALLFYEPSTRTFSSFAAAIKRLGGQTLEYQNPLGTSSAVKGETLEDTIRMFENYADCIILRHPEIGSAFRAAQAASFLPIINAGDGAGEHPTQALLDLYTIREKFGRLDNIKGLICADVKYGRGVHSQLKAFSLFKNCTIYLLAPKQLKLSKDQYTEYTKRGVKLVEIHTEEDIPNDCNFWYWSRTQKERFDNQRQKNIKMFRLTQKLINAKAGKDTIIMHILPRVDEVDKETDNDPRVIYLTKQVKNGMYVRMALIALVLGKTR